MKKILSIIFLLILTGCANKMKPTDFKDQKPRLIIEEYLSGNVKAWGVLQNRSGKVTRQFKADLNGKWNGSELILDEVFDWTDGERQTRQWQIKKIDEHYYEGTASDVVGTAPAKSIEGTVVSSPAAVAAPECVYSYLSIPPPPEAS